MQRLKQRADFLAAATGTKVPAAAFVVQMRTETAAGDVRVGFTVTKKIGNAVERNRIRRRLREVVRLTPPDAFRADHDYVLIGRRPALTLPFTKLSNDFSAALKRLHAGPHNNQKA
jgi:ribonuclease P protein component